MRSRSSALGLAAVTLLAAGGLRAHAYACSTDGIPSLLVDNRFVAVNTASASAGSLARWTPFVARGTYRVGTRLTLREDKLKVTESLPPMYFRDTWLWQVGDGASARGTAISHAYRRRGDYLVTVKAHLTAGLDNRWVTFDAVTIHVR